MNNVTAIKSEADANPPTINYGQDLIWVRSSRSDNVEYEATQPGIGSFRVYQYAPDSAHWCAGQWLWSVRFDKLVDENSNPKVLKLEASDIVATREDAMLACLDARGEFIHDMRQLLTRLCPDDAYATGFRAGQDALKQKIIEALE